MGLRHDTVRDTIANLLETAKGCKDIEIEKHLTPLVFTVQGGCGKECNAFLKQLAEKITKKSGEDQPAVMAWIRTKLSFALVRTSVVCLRGWKKKDKRNLSRHQHRD